MKRYAKIFLLFIIMFVVTGCGTQKKVIDEEALKAEIKAELKAEVEKEEAAKEAAKLAIKEKAEAEKAEEKAKEVPLDITNKKQVASFVYDIYGTRSSEFLQKEGLEDVVQWLYGDFDNNGVEDALCYTPIKGNLYQVAIVTIENNEFEIIPNELDDDESPSYITHITFDGLFLHYFSSGTGSGIYHNYDSLYVFNGEEIVYTGGSLEIEGYCSGPGFNIETVGKTLLVKAGDFSEFTHKEITTGTENYTITKVGKYNLESYYFEITESDTRE